MPCEHTYDRIGMLIDNELPHSEREALHKQTVECVTCARYRDELEHLGRRLRMVHQAAPARLLDRIPVRLSLDVEEDTDKNSELLRPPRVRIITARIREGLLPMLRQAAVLLLTCALSIAGASWWAQRMHEKAALSHDVLSAHVRSLLQDSTVQVASLDTHTVKPWFAGRLDYSPTVKDLSSEGFQLVGGRLDYVDGHRVATLVYRRRLHLISVFVWPSHDKATTPSYTRIDGYNLLTWNNGNMTRWVISDLNEGELRELQALL